MINNKYDKYEKGFLYLFLIRYLKQYNIATKQFDLNLKG